MNKAILLGRLGQDPEPDKKLDNKVNFTLATTSYGGGGAGHNTTWHNIITFDRTADLASQWLHKGDQVLIEGEIQNYSAKDMNGNTRTRTEIKAHRIHFIKNEIANIGQ